MDRTVAVYYNGSLAHYTVTRQNNGSLKAYLLNYHGSQQTPPAFLLIQKEGNQWTAVNGNGDLADYIGQVFENQYESNAGAASFKQESYV